MEEKISVVEHLFARHFKRLEELIISRMETCHIKSKDIGLVMATISKSYDFLLDDIFKNQKTLFKDWKNKYK